MRWKRLIARTSLVTLIAFVAVLILFDSCVQFRMSQKEIEQYFSGRKVKGVVDSYYVGNQKINYLTTGSDTLPLALFVHGSPGSLSAFIDFTADEQLLQRVQVISVDRPGFGASNFGYAEPSISKQAAELKPILERHKNQRPVILIGHSLGGPVIARMAMDFPELVDALVFVAPSIDPDLEPHEWFRAPLATPFLKWMLPRSLRASNDEIYGLKPELQKMLPLWSTVTAKTVVIQGTADELVHPGNAEFAKRMMVNAKVKVIMRDSMNHFVPWTNPELIRDAVIELASAN